MRETANIRSGMCPEDAHFDAQRRLGNETALKERTRDVDALVLIEAAIQDLRFGVRTLLKNPGFTSVAILTLALGIGANTAIFSLLDGLVLRALPVPHPEQLVRVGAHSPGDSFGGLSLPMYEEIARTQKVFSEMFAWSGDVVLNVEANGGVSRADIWGAGENFYSELGAVPEAGRLLASSDVNLTSAVPAQVAVLGYGFSKRHYGGSRDVIGKTIKIEGVPFTVIGVTREGFKGMMADLPPEVTIPITAMAVVFGESDVQKYLNRPDSRWLQAAGRLKPGFTLEQARGQLESLWPAIRQTTAPAARTPLDLSNFFSLQLKVESGERGGSFLRTRFVKPLYVLFAIAGIVLLATCLNLATLLLARGASRSHEIGVRVALGANRIRIARQMLTESMALSVTGTLGGLAFAYWGSRTLSAFILDQVFIVPAGLNLSPDWRMVGFTVAAAILTALLFGWAPAWRATREDPNTAIQQGSRAIARGTGSLGKGLIATQMALSLVLLTGAGLFIRSLQKLHAVQPGFRTHGILQVNLVPKPSGYKNLAWVNYYRDLNERVSNLPGVVSASLTHNSPAETLEWTEQVRVSRTDTKGNRADVAMVMPGAFRTMGIGILKGRSFNWQDDARTPRVAIVSRKFAERWFPNGGAIGQQLDITTQPKWQNLRIVGIASDVSLYDIRKDKPPTLYLPATQYGNYMGYPELLVQTNGAPAIVISGLRQTIESLGHEYVASIKTVENEVDRSLLQERLTAMLSSFFGILALLLAAIGLYGLMAYNVMRRSREIGIRMALGAQRASVQWMILSQTLTLALIGLAFGLPCAVAASRLIGSLLYGVSAFDPLTLIAVSIMLIAVAAVAGFIPARRAMRLDPVTVLRSE